MVNGFRPRTLREALQILSANNCTVMAGGTDLMVQRARGFSIRPDFDRPLVFIEPLEELKHSVRENGTLHLGPCMTLSDLLRHPAVPDPLKEIIGMMASPPTRNMATLGGNICNASPAGDTLPWLYAMNAKLKLQSAEKERIVAIEDFITGPKKTILQSDELLTGILVPDTRFHLNRYRKLGQRKGMSLTKASFLGMAEISGNTVTDIRIALGSVAPRIVRAAEIERSMLGRYVGDINAAAAVITERYQPLITPIDDARSTAMYRKKVSLDLIRQFLETLSGSPGTGTKSE